MTNLRERLDFLDRVQGLLIEAHHQLHGNYDLVAATVNELSRKMADGMVELYGTCWGYNLNGVDEMVEVEMEPGGWVSRTSVGIILPRRSPELLALIKQRRATMTVGSADEDLERVEIIIDLATSLGGLHLFWH
mgnify:CR=1 FL=1